MTKRCEICGRFYKAEVFNAPRQKYCSPECAREAAIQRKRQKRAEERVESEYYKLPKIWDVNDEIFEGV